MFGNNGSFKIHTLSDEHAEEILANAGSGVRSGKYDSMREHMRKMPAGANFMLAFANEKDARNCQSIVSDASVLAGWRENKDVPASQVYRTRVYRVNDEYRLLVKRLSA